MATPAIAPVNASGNTTSSALPTVDWASGLSKRRSVSARSNRREAAWTTATRWLLMASCLNGQRRGQVSGKVGISGSFQRVRDPRSPFVVDGQQFPGTGGGAVRRHLLEGHRAGVGAEDPLVEDVQLPPAEDRPQGSGGPPGCGWRRASAAALALAFTA